jgi:hypothetical protein
MRTTAEFNAETRKMNVEINQYCETEMLIFEALIDPK